MSHATECSGPPRDYISTGSVWVSTGLWCFHKWNCQTPRFSGCIPVHRQNTTMCVKGRECYMLYWWNKVRDRRILPKINSPHSKSFPQFLPKDTLQGVSRQVSQGVALFQFSNFPCCHRATVHSSQSSVLVRQICNWKCFYWSHLCIHMSITTLYTFVYFSLRTFPKDLTLGR